MNVRDLIPWNRGRDVTVRRGEEANPFLMLHREMNRLFDDVSRGFELTPFGVDRSFARTPPLKTRERNGITGSPSADLVRSSSTVKVAPSMPMKRVRTVMSWFLRC